MSYVESTVRTNKLWCSMCQKKIKKGDTVIFELDRGKMQDVFCDDCKTDYMVDAYHDSCIHPFSDEAFNP